MCSLKNFVRSAFRTYECSFMVLIILFNLSCSRPYPVRNTQYIGPLGLYFRIEIEGEGVVFSFGEKKDSIFPDYFEKINCGESDGRTFFFIVDNSSGTPKIKHIIFIPMQFLDIHIPNYPYSIDYFATNSLSNLTRKSALINSNIWPDTKYYVLRMWPTSYYKGVNYEIYKIDKIDDTDSISESFTDENYFLPYRDLKKTAVSLGYSENVDLYGNPKMSKRFTVTEDSRKAMIKVGWLFVDTMNLIAEPVLEIDKWKVDDHILSMIYRIDSHGERIPVNGARYNYIMEKRKENIHYQ